MEALHERARAAYPERWAPNGEALMGYPGASWDERMVAWEFAQRMAEEPEIPDVDEDTGHVISVAVENAAADPS